LHWEAEPSAGESNPALEPIDGLPWPITGDASARARREDAATRVRHAIESRKSQGEEFAESAKSAASDPALTPVEADLVAQWDHDAAALLAEARQRHETAGDLPPLVSATTAVHILRDPTTARRRIIRPLPARPAEAATRGTRFHQWVEARFGQVPLLDLEAPGDDGGVEGAELAALQEAFLSGPYADRQPAAVEAPFQLVLGQGTVAGRIDAVYRVDGDDQDGLPEGAVFEVVDWKTGLSPADVFQLAIYRLAWAELNDLPLEKVAASFYYVATGERERPSDLPDRALLTEWWARATA
jgi:DNA helicase-2/ATP-dependent DNA helicase PcrA